MAIRVKLLLTIWVIVFLVSGALSWLTYDLHKKEYLDGVDRQLLTATHMARALLPKDYHDRIVDESSVDEMTYLTIVDTYNEICMKTDLQYLWSTLVLDDRIVFTTATSASKRLEGGDHASFFDIHTDPKAFAPVIASEKIAFSSFSNEWGAGRMVLVPDRDSKGRLFIFGASMSMQHLNANLEQAILKALGIFLLALLVGAAVAYPIARTLSVSLIKIAEAAERIANDDLSLAVDPLLGKEMQAVSASFNRMIAAVRERHARLRRLVQQWKKAEETLAVSEERFRNLVESTSDWVWEIDHKYRYTYVSPKVRDILGLEPSQIIGRSPFDLMLPAEAKRIEREFRPIRESQIPFSGLVNTCLHISGRHVCMETSGVPIFDKNNSFAGYRGIDRDVTVRKETEAKLMAAHAELEAKVRERTHKLEQEILKHEQTEKALTSAKEEAEKASQAKSEFLSSMSHELRTPLNSILGFGQVLQEDLGNPLSPEDRETAIDFILKAGRHLLDLVDQMLELNKIEAGKMSLTIEPISPRPIIRDCLSFIRAKAAEVGVVVIDQTESMELPVLLADSTRLGQVLLNLLSNASKYNRIGGALTLSCETMPDHMLRITVSDTGLGIPKDRQERLFVPFERLGMEAGKVEGTGIGLSITKKIVEEMGGRIGFTSEEYVGSRFWVDIPLNDRAMVEAASAPAKVPPAKSVDLLTSTQGRKRSILYVEDNQANQMLMELIVGRLPDTWLITASSGEEGVALAQRHIPDLVLMDINLPGMSGFDALKALKELPKMHNVGVVAVSAAAMTLDIHRGKEAGFDDYIIKPFDIPAVIAVISQHLAKDKGRVTSTL